MPPLYGDFTHPTTKVPFFRYPKPKRDPNWDRRFVDLDDITAKRKFVEDDKEEKKRKRKAQFGKSYSPEKTKAFNMSNVAHKHPISSKGFARNCLGGFFKDFQEKNWFWIVKFIMFVWLIKVVLMYFCFNSEINF